MIAESPGKRKVDGGWRMTDDGGQAESKSGATLLLKLKETEDKVAGGEGLRDILFHREVTPGQLPSSAAMVAKHVWSSVEDEPDIAKTL